MQPIITAVLPQPPPAHRLPPDLRVRTPYRVERSGQHAHPVALIDSGWISISAAGTALPPGTQNTSTT